jgi:CspA family cold shock protein
VFAVGTVASWSNEDGWGVIEASCVPGGCWLHYSAILGGGFRTVTPGDAVQFRYERADQDGYAYRAVEVWPAGVAKPRQSPSDASIGAYRSELRITYDE